MLYNKRGKFPNTKKYEQYEQKEVKTMKQQNGCLQLLDSVKQGSASYAFLSLQFERALGYAVYIERGDAYALELIGNKRRESEKIFRQIVRGELSPMHLREVAADQTVICPEKLEIFC